MARTKHEEPAVRGVGAYLGGHPNEVQQRGGQDGRDAVMLQGHLEMTSTAIYVIPHRRQGGLPLRAVVPWSNVASVSMESYSEAKSRLGPVLVFGLLGLAARTQAESTVLAVRLLDGGTVYYQAHLNFMTFRANVTHILRSLGVTVIDGLPVQTSPVAPATASVADELAKLAQLRDSGILTDEEFAAQKARLLA